MVKGKGESRSIRIPRDANRALKNYFAARFRAFALWDEFGHEPESATVRDAIARCHQRGDQARKVMERHLGRRVAAGVRAWYDRNVFMREYGEWRRGRFPLDINKIADPEVRALVQATETLKKDAEDLDARVRETSKLIASLGGEVFGGGGEET